MAVMSVFEYDGPKRPRANPCPSYPL